MNEIDRINLRKYLESELKGIPAGTNLQVDKELLESALFETVVHSVDGKEKMAKYIVWSSYVLRGIDLSEVNFDDVVWDMDDYREWFNMSVCRPRVFLSGTNASVDFEKSFPIRSGNGSLRINGVDLSGVDLSEANGELIREIKDSNLANTDIKLNFSQKNFKIADTDLSGNSFDGISIDGRNSVGTDKIDITTTNFANTGIDFIMPVTDVDEIAEQIDALYKKSKVKTLSYPEGAWLDSLERAMVEYELYKMYVEKARAHDYLEGCTVNGKEVLPVGVHDRKYYEDKVKEITKRLEYKLQ